METVSLEDISKMKVAELKKHLKLKGLSVTGNKNELVERLQEAFETDGIGGLEPSGTLDEEEFDEEEILGEVDGSSKITLQEEAAVLSENKTRSDNQVEKKKISLKRSEPCLTANTETDKTDLTEEKENAGDESAEPKHKVIKLSSSEITTPSARAIKFGTEVEAKPAADDAKAARATRFGANNARPKKLSTETGGINLDQLKKRADRFGEVTSKSLETLKSAEKKKQREDRFGKEATNGKVTKSSAVDDKKTARAARFGSSNGTTTTSSDADDAKTKRAARFSK